jgi:arylsulfatase A-like enzyme
MRRYGRSGEPRIKPYPTVWRWLRAGLASLCALLALVACQQQRPLAVAELATWRPKYTLLVSVDTCRADHVGFWGYERNTTPYLDRFAREGVAFTRAYSQSNESLFSYASLMAGVYASTIAPPDHQTFWLRHDFETLAQWLRAGGIKTTAYTGGGAIAADRGFDHGFEVYSDLVHFGTFYHTMPQALTALEAATRGAQPAFIWVQGYDAHAPYSKPLPLGYGPRPSARVQPLLESSLSADFTAEGAAFKPQVVMEVAEQALLRSPRVLDPVEELVQVLHTRPLSAAQEAGRSVLTAEERAAVVGAYDGALTYADAWLGILRAEVERLGIAEQTLIVLMGDHGEDLFEHGYLGHRNTLAESTLHVPLVFWAPALWRQGVRVEATVELRALRPTLMALLGPRSLASASAGSSATGASLVPHLLRAQHAGPLTSPPGGTQADGALDTPVTVAEGVCPSYTVRCGRYRLVTGLGSSHEVPPDPQLAAQLAAFRLYDCQADPREQVNLLTQPAWQGAEGLAMVRTLRHQLLEALAQGARPAGF